MKTNFAFHFLLYVFLLLSVEVFCQMKSVNSKSTDPETILWKVSGKGIDKPSYILGTCHLSDADWLYEFPTMKMVIDSTEYILTEAFSTEMPEESFGNGPKLQALPLLTKVQYNTLDSFFVARVGEGIVNNKDFEEMSVAGLNVAILITLSTQTTGANGFSKSMDLDLFTLYKKLGRKGDRLDRVRSQAIDPDSVEHAKQYLARSIGYIKNSDKPDWNIYQTKGVDELLVDYKKMKVKYNLDKPDNFEASTDYDFVPMKTRNQEWMVKITTNIERQPCLIAVGLAHLCYRISLINLLREQGYKVEPVFFK